MKLTTMTQVTVDGVMQGNGGASDEDRRNGFERGGWAMGVADNETMTFINQTYQRADAFLFGRRTYELFAGYWGAEERARAAAEDPGNHQITDALNTKPKYLVSNTLTEPRWANTTVLSGDLAAAIGELKAKPAGELQVHGSGRLVRWLFANHLVDEIPNTLVPVSELGKALGIDTQMTDVIIDLGCAMTQIDFRKHGRTLEVLGLEGMTREEMLQYVNFEPLGGRCRQAGVCRALPYYS